MSNIFVIFCFLKDFIVNNNCEWFNEYWEEYEIVCLEFENFFFIVIVCILFFDESICGI